MLSRKRFAVVVCAAIACFGAGFLWRVCELRGLAESALAVPAANAAKSSAELQWSNSIQGLVVQSRLELQDRLTSTKEPLQDWQKRVNGSTSLFTKACSHVPLDNFKSIPDVTIRHKAKDEMNSVREFCKQEVQPSLEQAAASGTADDVKGAMHQLRLFDERLSSFELLLKDAIDPSVPAPGAVRPIRVCMWIDNVRRPIIHAEDLLHEMPANPTPDDLQEMRVQLAGAGGQIKSCLESFLPKELKSLVDAAVRRQAEVEVESIRGCFDTQVLPVLDRAGRSGKLEDRQAVAHALALLNDRLPKLETIVKGAQEAPLPPSTRPHALRGQWSGLIRTSKQSVALLRKEFLHRQTQGRTEAVSDQTLRDLVGILGALLSNTREALQQNKKGDAARDEALTQVDAAYTLYKTKLLPAFDRAMESDKPEDAKAVVELLDQFDRHLDAWMTVAGNAEAGQDP